MLTAINFFLFVSILFYQFLYFRAETKVTTASKNSSVVDISEINLFLFSLVSQGKLSR